MKRFLRIRRRAALVTAFVVVLFAMSAAAAFSLWAGTPVRTMVDNNTLEPGDGTIVTVRLLSWTPDEVGIQYQSIPADVWQQALLDPPTSIYADSDTPFFQLRRSAPDPLSGPGTPPLQPLHRLPTA